MRGRALLLAVSLAACGDAATSVDGGSDAPVDAPADASALPRPADRLFVEAAVYQWQALDELAVSAYYVPVPAVQAAGREAMRKLLRQAQRLPAEVQARLRANARFYGL